MGDAQGIGPGLKLAANLGIRSVVSIREETEGNRD